MVYIKHIKIKPVRSKTNFLMWHASYYINRCGSWEFVTTELRYLSLQAFDDIGKVLKSQHVKVINA